VAASNNDEDVDALEGGGDCPKYREFDENERMKYTYLGFVFITDRARKISIVWALHCVVSLFE
jgi:hypothetical protein